METIKELIDLITLEKVKDCVFKGDNYKTPWMRVFGGQVLAQSLHAAYQSVPEDKICHSLHGYFILAGDINIPIIFEVDTIRDGGSFTTRRVVAKQNGAAIFIMAASFQKQQSGFEHQISAPNVLPPDSLLQDFEQLKDIRDKFPRLYRRMTAIHPNAIEFRPVEKFIPTVESRPYLHTWMRSREKTDIDLRMQHQILAYASDYNLLGTSVLPHKHKMGRDGVFFASLDHAMWFHRDFRIDDWLLYATDSPSASNSRGFTRGSIFSESGTLVASVVQEGLIREMRKK